MRGLTSCVVCLLLLIGCGGGKAVHPGASDGGDAGAVLIDVSGTARLYPPAAAYMKTSGHQEPAIAGLTLRLEDALRAALLDPQGEFGQVTLDGSGGFGFKGVPASEVTWQLAADVREAADGGPGGTVVFPATTVLYDVGYAQTPPSSSLDGGWVEVLPVHFVDALGTSVGAGAIQAIGADAGNPQQSTLEQSGFIVGRVLDDAGVPLAAVALTADDPALAAHFFYPTPDFTGALDGGTSSSGLYVFVHDGSARRPFTLSVVGHPEYGHRNATAAAGQGQVLDLRP